MLTTAASRESQVLPSGAEFSVRVVRFAGHGEAAKWGASLHLSETLEAADLPEAREKLLEALLPRVEQVKTDLMRLLGWV